MPPSTLQTSHIKQNSVKTPTKLIPNHQQNASYSGDNTSFSEKKEDGMKICRGPFNVNCTTSKDP